MAQRGLDVPRDGPPGGLATPGPPAPETAPGLPAPAQRALLRYARILARLPQIDIVHQRLRPEGLRS